MNFTPDNLNRWKRPECYIGATWEGYYVAPCGLSRDSDCLARANWEAQNKALLPLGADIPDSYWGLSSPVVVTENHWACGWISWLAIHETNEAALRKADELAGRLENHPVLDEQALSQIESELYFLDWRSGMGKDFAKCVRDSFRVAGSKFSDRLTDFLSEHLDQLQELYQELTPSGDYWQENGWRSRLLNAADALTRDRFIRFLRTIKTK